MDQYPYYRIPDIKVAHEIIDGTAIIIHFDTGNYYSLDGISTKLWQWFGAGASRQQILDAFKDIGPDQIQSLDVFIDDLVKEELLEKIISNAGHQMTSPLPKHEIAFESPKFQKYNDMQNLLLSDPIHEADERGWPNLKTDNM